MESDATGEDKKEIEEEETVEETTMENEEEGADAHLIGGAFLPS